MELSKRFRITLTLAFTLIACVGTQSAEYDGVVKVGYVYIDDEGNRGVQQPTYNLYEGAALSLERFSYRFDDGTRLYGNLKNLTLNNRNLIFGAAKSGLYGLTIRNNQYRRTYSLDGVSFTRRRQTEGQAWVQPHEHFRLFGGYGRTDKRGRIVELFEPIGVSGIGGVDYAHQHFNVGVKFKYRRTYARMEYRGSNYTDDTNEINDRTTRRFRLIAATPLPKYNQFLLNGGFQRFENELANRHDTLFANTVWAGVRYFYGDGYDLNYSYIFDRSRRTGDLTATDNITHAVYAGKTWRRRGGVTVGYRHRINDDIRDEVTTNGYFFSGWVKVTPELTVKAGHGSETKEVQEGRTLTGDEDFARYWSSAQYEFKHGSIRAKITDKRTENDNIGSTVGFTSVGSDVSLSIREYGQLQASYAFNNGEYKNSAGRFEFKEHLVAGDVLSVAYYNVQAGFGGTYMRTKRDLDIESFLVRLTGIYSFSQSYKVEIVYSAFNFDDFNDISPVYSRYYTTNIVEIGLSKQL